jgi:hypothetical protein
MRPQADPLCESPRSHPRFWAAVWEGLAAPINLYARSAPYAAYIGGYSLPQTFATIGGYMNQDALHFPHYSDGSSAPP